MTMPSSVATFAPDRGPLLPRRAATSARDCAEAILGDSAPMCELREEIARVARANAKVLVTGESGTGKELVAQAIHAGSARASHPFIAMNCAGMPETLLESELFGHVRGSFTGAYRDKIGKLEAADRGTIFLDEVGEMTLRMQGMLLRFLETGELQKIGADRTDSHTNVRVIAATNRHLPELIAQGQFREDLYYRLKVIQLHMPPLRERGSDIVLLATYFLEEFAARAGSVARTLTPEAQAALSRYHWPGNVRELENVIEAVTVTTSGERVDVRDLPPEISSTSNGGQPRRERRRTVADDLFDKLLRDGESFWTAVYPLYMQRDITRENIRELVRKGLKESRGSYMSVIRLFNMEPHQYKRFLNFLRKHDCQLPYRTFR